MAFHDSASEGPQLPSCHIQVLAAVTSLPRFKRKEYRRHLSMGGPGSLTPFTTAALLPVASSSLLHSVKSLEVRRGLQHTPAHPSALGLDFFLNWGSPHLGPMPTCLHMYIPSLVSQGNPVRHFRRGGIGPGVLQVK